MHIEQEVGELLLKKHLKISTAESCTGGLLSSKLTDVAGSSEYITFNVVTYANEIKNKILGVTWGTLNTHGAVSAECATEMVLGLQKLTNADICVATTGIAGPGGGTVEKPVGTCYVGILYNGKLKIKKLQGDENKTRKELKEFFANSALELVKLELCSNLF